MNPRDTIVAISTPAGRGGIGVVRISGDRSRDIATEILKFSHPPRWVSWTNQLAELVDRTGSVVDQVVAAVFEAPRSYTSEDVVEIS